MQNCGHTVITTPENNCERISTTGEKCNKMLKTSFPQCGNTNFVFLLLFLTSHTFLYSKGEFLFIMKHNE